jgi:hypothetical protein
MSCTAHGLLGIAADQPGTKPLLDGERSLY